MAEIVVVFFLLLVLALVVIQETREKIFSFLWSVLGSFISYCRDKYLTRKGYKELEESDEPFAVPQSLLDTTTKFLEKTSSCEIDLNRHNVDKELLTAIKVGTDAIAHIYPSTSGENSKNNVSIDRATAEKIAHSLRSAGSYWDANHERTKMLVAKDLIARYRACSKKKKRFFRLGLKR